MELLSEHVCFGGVQRFYQHTSTELGLPARFSVFLPPAALQANATVPVLLYLAGLTCNEETFMIKAGAQRVAAELGLALVCPDTSPRGAGVAGETDAWDLGVGAGFYLNATQTPWSKNYRMQTYLHDELMPMLGKSLPINLEKMGLFGHSMGGHGALTLALKYPDWAQSLSAFAPICAPSQCPWGEKAFSAYLGDDKAVWLEHDASALMLKRSSPLLNSAILIDQGLSDKFLIGQLNPKIFEKACETVRQVLTLRFHEGYDHGYYFISSFIEDHLRHHANILR
jgi:S-formylglutathione hydrolase